MTCRSSWSVHMCITRNMYIDTAVHVHMCIYLESKPICERAVSRSCFNSCCTGCLSLFHVCAIVVLRFYWNVCVCVACVSRVCWLFMFVSHLFWYGSAYCSYRTAVPFSFVLVQISLLMQVSLLFWCRSASHQHQPLLLGFQNVHSTFFLRLWTFV